MYFTTAKSCEIKNIGKPKFSFNSFKDLKPAPEQICPIETDSSQTINLGCNIVLAIPMRCLCPPENSCGYRLKYSAPKPTLSRISIVLLFSLCHFIQSMHFHRFHNGLPTGILGFGRDLENDLNFFS
jgi:hypothetical protein